MKIKSITKRKASGKFYDITVAKNHNFLANGCLVHNCNTSAQNAIIVGVQRGIQDVDELDIIQMAGRAGRFGKSPYGNVFLICDNVSSWKKKIANPRNVTSTLLNTHALSFHLCAEIKNGVIKDAESMYNWYQTTLASIQNPLTKDHIDEVLTSLADWKAIKILENGTFQTTNLGNIAATLYYHPEDVHHWWQSFSYIDRNNLWHSDVAVSYALAAPTMQLPYISQADAQTVNVYMAELRNIWKNGPRTKASTLARDLQNYLNGDKMTPIVRTMQNDSDRIGGAIQWIAGVARIQNTDMVRILSTRLRYGISAKLVELVQLPGIGAAKARKLATMGILTWDEVIKNPTKVQRVVGENSLKKVIATARNLQRQVQNVA